MNKEISVFTFENYKEFLGKLVASHPKGIVTRLSEAAGCQRSYLSEVLRGHVHLTPDQGFGIAKFLDFTRDESDYFLSLIHFARASSAKYRKELQSRITERKNEFLRVSKRVEKNSPLLTAADAYYSSWYYAAVHISTSIPGMNTPGKISNYLGITDFQVRQILDFLAKHGYVNKSKDTDSYAFNADKKNFHLNDESILSNVNHINWRAFALSRPMSPGKEVHYSSVFTLTRATYERIKQQLLNLIDQQRQEISASGSEVVSVFCCDLFDI